MTKALTEQLKVWHLIVGLVVMAGSLLTVAGANYANFQNRLQDNEQSVRMQDNVLIENGRLLKDMNDRLIRMETDLQWLRSRNEKR